VGISKCARTSSLRKIPQNSHHNVADRVGTVKLMAQHGLMLKPRIEEAIVPSKGTMSTYSSYLRKVTSYVASWTGCITMKILRSYRKKSDAEWIRLYNYCLQKTNLSQSHMYLGAKELAALCGVLETDEQVVREALRPITNRRFLNQLQHRQPIVQQVPSEPQRPVCLRISTSNTRVLPETLPTFKGH